jgi:alpha-L-arabinofuranosidase
METLAEAAWAELAVEAKKPLAKTKPAFRDKLRAFIAEFGETEFARSKATEIAALREAGSFDKWSHGTGQWTVNNHVLSQTTHASDCRSFAPAAEWTDYIYTVEARKVNGREGFLILFRVKDKQHFYWWNVGGWFNTCHTVETRGPRKIFKQKKGRIETDRWYKIKIKVQGPKIECYIDDQLIESMTDSTYDSGGIGLGSWLTSVQYRNVMVTSIDGRTVLCDIPAPTPASSR